MCYIHQSSPDSSHITHGRVCATQVLRAQFKDSKKPRVRIKYAKLNLVKINAEISLSERLSNTPVQEREYIDATCTVHLWDPDGLPCIDASTDAEARADLLRQIHLFVGIGGGSARPIYIISIAKCPDDCPRAVMAATVPGEEDDYSPRAVRVHLGVKKLDKMSKTVEEILHTLNLGIQTGHLAEVFGVRETAIYGCQVTPSQEEVTNAPTLLEIKEESHNALGPKVRSSRHTCIITRVTAQGHCHPYRLTPLPAQAHTSTLAPA